MFKTHYSTESCEQNSSNVREVDSFGNHPKAGREPSRPSNCQRGYPLPRVQKMGYPVQSKTANDSPLSFVGPGRNRSTNGSEKVKYRENCMGLTART
jgi:hypothetical protein